MPLPPALLVLLSMHLGNEDLVSHPQFLETGLTRPHWFSILLDQMVQNSSKQSERSSKRGRLSHEITLRGEVKQRMVKEGINYE